MKPPRVMFRGEIGLADGAESVRPRYEQFVETMVSSELLATVAPGVLAGFGRTRIERQYGWWWWAGDRGKSNLLEGARKRSNFLDVVRTHVKRGDLDDVGVGVVDVIEGPLTVRIILRVTMSAFPSQPGEVGVHVEVPGSVAREWGAAMVRAVFELLCEVLVWFEPRNGSIGWQNSGDYPHQHVLPAPLSELPTSQVVGYRTITFLHRDAVDALGGLDVVLGAPVERVEVIGDGDDYKGVLALLCADPMQLTDERLRAWKQFLGPVLVEAQVGPNAVWGADDVVWDALPDDWTTRIGTLPEAITVDDSAIDPSRVDAGTDDGGSDTSGPGGGG